MSASSISSPYSIITNWAEQGLISEEIISETKILSPLRNLILQKAPFDLRNETLIKVTKVALCIVFIVALVFSSLVNLGQHLWSSLKLTFYIPFHLEDYPELMINPDGPQPTALEVCGSGVLNFFLSPIWAVLSTLGSAIKTYEKFEDLSSKEPKLAQVEV